MKLVGTVVIINRLAQSCGHGANSKLGKACKSVIQVRDRADGRHVLVISTRKDVTAYEYYVKRIETLRTKCIEDGFATIDISEPPMSVMIRGCDPDELKKFIKYLETFLKATNAKQSAGIKTNQCTEKKENMKADASATTTHQEQNGNNEKLTKDNLGSMRRSSGSIKRPRSPELSKANIQDVKKRLLSTNVITVKKRENYPKQFQSSLEQVKIQTVGLRKLDERILKLRLLTVLDLAENQIKNVDKLTDLKCQLKSLNLAKNQITTLPDDFFSFPCLYGLDNLDLSNNQLTKLPTSINSLHLLTHAKFNRNKLAFLPYNLKGLNNMYALDVSDNLLEFVPATLSLLPIFSLDFSGNPAVLHNTIVPETKHDFIGYATVPTLFEMACEVVINDPTQQKGRLSSVPPQPLPSIIQTYLRSGKYCMKCLKMSLRYKITTTLIPTRSLCVGALTHCLISPVSQCFVKTILCYNCDPKDGIKNVG